MDAAYEQCQKIELTVPADRRMMIVIRLTTSGVVARAGLTLDAVEDLKMAVEEACVCLIRHSNCAFVRLSYCIGDGEVSVSVRGEGCGATDRVGPHSGEEIEIIRCILESMADGVSITERNGCIEAIEMRKRLPVIG